MRLHAATGARLYINEHERRRFMEATRVAPVPFRRLCLVLTFTGCRVSEALALTGQSIQTDTATIAIRTLKKRRHTAVREVPVPTSLIAELTPDERPSDARLFPVCRTTAWRQVKSVMDAASITGPQATAKGLRHGFGVHALQSGVPLNLLQKWMGHAHISVTAVYGNAVGPEERMIAERMWHDICRTN
ncbi:MAG: site-specific integrase [Roseitalea porphyridii]